MNAAFAALIPILAVEHKPLRVDGVIGPVDARVISEHDIIMADLLLRNVPPKTLDALKARARERKRSVQAEALDILEATRSSEPSIA